MRSKTTARSSATPAGNLAEAQLHRVLGYQLAQATIATTAVYTRMVGEPFGLGPVEFTMLSLINDSRGGSPAQLAPGHRLLVERQQPHGVPRQDQRLDLVAEPRLFEILQPALRRDQRKVAAEQDAVLQQGVGVLHQLRRKVLRAPAREVDPDVGL